MSRPIGIAVGEMMTQLDEFDPDKTRLLLSVYWKVEEPDFFCFFVAGGTPPLRVLDDIIAAKKKGAQ